MYDALKFCQGGVAKKEIIEGLSHFRIENETVRSYNGSIALCSPINLDFDCTPQAIPMLKAIINCDSDVHLTMTAAGRLSIKSGGFNAFIQCISTPTPHVDPEGEYYPINGETMLLAVRTLLNFVGTDATRKYCTGVRLNGQFAYATNNILCMQYWMQDHFPIDVNIPVAALRELVRIKEIPIAIQCNDKSITFHYESGRWLRSATLENNWPDFSRILDQPCSPVPIDETIFDAIDLILPFADSSNKMYMENGFIRTHEEFTEGANSRIMSTDAIGIFAMPMFKLLNGVAKTIDLTMFPRPCLFFGENLRGAIIGFRPK